MLCLFDLDGTLIDSEEGIVACVRHAFDRLGVAAPAELRHWIGPPLRHSFAPFLDHDHERVEAAVEYYHERFHTLGWREHSVYPDIEETIIRLKAAGHELAVVTSKPERHARPIVENLPFGKAFSRLYGPDPLSPHSEKATMIAAAIADFGAAREYTAMIGDRHFDIDGAVANGIRGVGVLWGFGDRAELEKAGAHALAKQPLDLVGMLAA
ncbi:MULTISPECIES: HAD hydrolase-like protein [Dyella]|uniref:HAD family hydrolase n=2 Tax=Dyella TaxID=231454 RepID=A0A4R0YZ06_9GAMM|nr:MULTISPECIES: HAD hydrolase-like protein [Dyella]TBR40381.1 HAD family hydrolase [Dyella terrae]TCI12036.1 HAD family hydrolase [Dyella soli]